MRVYHREAEEILTYRLPDVAKNCLHNTLVGKAFLSTLTETELKQTLDRIYLKGRTKNTISDRDQLLTEIERTRKRGYAMCVEEYQNKVKSKNSILLRQHFSCPDPGRF